jgi:hypothetical protein
MHVALNARIALTHMISTQKMKKKVSDASLDDLGKKQLAVFAAMFTMNALKISNMS